MVAPVELLTKMPYALLSEAIVRVISPFLVLKKNIPKTNPFTDRWLTSTSRTLWSGSTASVTQIPAGAKTQSVGAPAGGTRFVFLRPAPTSSIPSLSIRRASA